MLLHATETLATASQTALPMSERASVALSTTLTGLVVVFLALILLTFVISIFGKVVGGATAKTAKPKPAPAPVPAPAAPVVEVAPVGETVDYNDDELIAVIAAAVYAYGEASGKKYAVRSVRPSGRSNWAAAGVIENTRPF